MWHPYSQKWSPSVLATLGIFLGLCGPPVRADHLGHTQNYDVVQGYIIQGQPQSQACVPAQTPTPLVSAQNQSTTLSLAPTVQKPATQTVTLQLAPTQTPVQTLQLAPQAPQVQTLQLAPTQQVQFQTLQMAPAQVQFQTLQLAPALVQVQTVQLAPVQTQTLQLASQAVATQSVTPVTLLLPRHKCNWFCKYRH
jgi:hypothetical protein